MSKKSFLITSSCLLILGACVHTGGDKSLHSANQRNMTVGVVQKEIHRGMSQADVAGALGSPNIVTQDSTGKETWIYDKIATEASYAYSNVGVSAGVGAGGMPPSTLILGGLGFGASVSKGKSAVTQKTLTVIIKFNRKNLVDSFNYHSTTF